MVYNARIEVNPAQDAWDGWDVRVMVNGGSLRRFDWNGSEDEAWTEAYRVADEETRLLRHQRRDLEAMLS